MPAVPSIKGSVFVSVVEDVKKLLAAGAISPPDLARWLTPEDRALLDKTIVISSWYDVRSYTRMNDLLRDVEGGGSNEYLRLAGRQTARRLLEAGLYSQLEYCHRTELASTQDPQARFQAFGRDLRRLTTLSGSILNFSRWAPKPADGQERRYVIEVSEAADLPEVLCWRSDGLINEMATTHGEPDLWAWDRRSPDLVVFRMLRSL